MRVNVYAEELTDDVRLVTTDVVETGKAYHGIRFYLHSSERLHHSAEDDDRSAVTLWANRKYLRELFTKALRELEELPYHR